MVQRNLTTDPKSKNESQKLKHWNFFCTITTPNYQNNDFLSVFLNFMACL